MSTTPVNATNATTTDAEKYARIVNILIVRRLRIALDPASCHLTLLYFQRNMAGCKRSEDCKVVVPVRTTSNPSPPKKTASNRHPGQTHTRTEVTCTTLGGIRGFLDQIETLNVENRVPTVSVSELKRPVKYFWGVHDFVRGLRGALLGTFLSCRRD